MEAEAVILVDARGLRCPLPVLRLQARLEEADRWTLLTDDPAAAVDVPAFARERGLTCDGQGDGRGMRWTLRR
jgi:tRNA 2-thiouridine synthesizing protein A